MFFSALCILFLFIVIDSFIYSELEFTTTFSISVVGVVTYDNADTDKERIYNENRGKVGVYR